MGHFGGGACGPPDPVPIDGSPLSAEALEVAPTEYPDAAIAARHVVDPTEPGYSYYPCDADADHDFGYSPRFGPVWDPVLPL